MRRSVAVKCDPMARPGRPVMRAVRSGRLGKDRHRSLRPPPDPRPRPLGTRGRGGRRVGPGGEPKRLCVRKGRCSEARRSAAAARKTLTVSAVVASGVQHDVDLHQRPVLALRRHHSGLRAKSRDKRHARANVSSRRRLKAPWVRTSPITCGIPSGRGARVSASLADRCAGRSAYQCGGRWSGSAGEPL
jgi:hypothetical protein